jgi:hypothetical protein
MKSLRLFAVFLVIVVVQSCCWGGGKEIVQQQIGTVQRVRSVVQSGPQNSLVEVTDIEDLFNDDAVRVTQGGSARLLFGNQIQINLFNDSELGGVKADVASGTPKRVAWKLLRGGLSGQVAQPGGQAEISVQTGVKVTVLGTRFFVTYEPNSGYVVVGNFDGKINLSFNGSSERSVPIGEMIDISESGETAIYPIPFGPDEFDRIVGSVGSPIDALYGMRREYQIPLPGQGVAAEAPVTEAPQAFTTRALVWPEGDSFIPDLASSWEVSEDGSSWTFYLADGIYMPDGGLFTSEIVKERFQDWDLVRNGWVSVESIDDFTVQLYVEGGYSFLKERGYDNNGFLMQIAKLTFKVQQ